VQGEKDRYTVTRKWPCSDAESENGPMAFKDVKEDLVSDYHGILYRDRNRATRDIIYRYGPPDTRLGNVTDRPFHSQRTRIKADPCNK
jgi:hypothetical protein